MTVLSYLQGLGNYLQSEALPDVLIPGRNSPQKVKHGLYAEQLSGSAFTMQRHTNLHSWLYRIRPSVVHAAFHPLAQGNFLTPPFTNVTPPTQMRWDPMPYPQQACDFIQGLWTVAGNGNVETHTGAAVHWYVANQSMQHTFFYNADGELLIVPQEGNLLFKTEFGHLGLQPGEMAVIPRGVKFQVILEDERARGYVCENFGLPFRLPELGFIGANGLAQARDFQMPCSHFENVTGEFTLIAKFQGQLFSATINHSPVDVVAWHGNYVPYKYDLHLFNTINTVSFDHPDPSIFTVLTSPSAIPGMANVDFVIFPSRWMVAEDTFRPPYYHRNVMSELMGLIKGEYDAKRTNFAPGALSLHNCMSAHGPDANAYHDAVNAELTPQYYANQLAFMVESSLVWRLTPQALAAPWLQADYLACWQDLKAQFTQER